MFLTHRFGLSHGVLNSDKDLWFICHITILINQHIQSNKPSNYPWKMILLKDTGDQFNKHIFFFNTKKESWQFGPKIILQDLFRCFCRGDPSCWVILSQGPVSVFFLIFFLGGERGKSQQKSLPFFQGPEIASIFTKIASFVWTDFWQESLPFCQNFEKTHPSFRVFSWNFITFHHFNRKPNDIDDIVVPLILLHCLFEMTTLQLFFLEREDPPKVLHPTVRAWSCAWWVCSSALQWVQFQI